MRAIDRTDDLKSFLLHIFNTRLWDRTVSYKGHAYIYISSRNEFREIINQPSGNVSIIIGIMVLPINKFMWTVE